MENKEESFRYTYNAVQQAEIEKIRNKYSQPAENKMELLRKLDRSASQKAQLWAITIGVIGALILGTGMSFAMTDLGKLLEMHSQFAMLIGIVIGIVGLVLVALAYPVYSRILRKERQRIAPQILRLTDELMQ